MRELAIVLGLIKQGDNYLLQFRDGDPKIGAANMVGCFGGKIEESETPAVAVCRELREETTLTLTEEDVSYLGKVDVVSDHNLEEVRVIAEVFLVQIDSMVVRAREGSLVSLAATDAADRLGRMTPGTRAVFEQFVLNKG